MPLGVPPASRSASPPSLKRKSNTNCMKLMIGLKDVLQQDYIIVQYMYVRMYIQCIINHCLWELQIHTQKLQATKINFMATIYRFSQESMLLHDCAEILKPYRDAMRTMMVKERVSRAKGTDVMPAPVVATLSQQLWGSNPVQESEAR